MPYIVRDLPNLVTFTSSGGTAVTSGIGHLDDASSITIYFTSSASAATSAAVIQIAQFDPADTFPQVGVSQSSMWFIASTSGAVFTTGGVATLNNVSFRGLRLQFTATSSSNGEIVAFATKQISV